MVFASAMTSDKSCDFLSELKATLSKLTAHDEADSPRNVTECAQQTPEISVTRNVDRHYHLDAHHYHLQSARVCHLYGELNSVLEMRGQQQQLTDQQTASRVVDLESRLKPGKSIVYLGSGQRRATAAQHQQSGSDIAVTSSLSSNIQTAVTDSVMKAAGCVEEDNNSTGDVISTSSAVVSLYQMCTSSNHGNQDSACIMSADDSAECSDCSLLKVHEQQRDFTSDNANYSVVQTHSEYQQLTLSSDDDEQQQEQWQRGQVQCDFDRQHFATFPLIRSTPTSTYRTPPGCEAVAAIDGDDDDDDVSVKCQRHDDVIATLMITHSGEPITVSLSHQDNVVDRPLSVPVTVPEPTSFHKDGSQIRQQLLEHHTSASSQRQRQQDKSASQHDYERRCRRAGRRRHRLQQAVVESTTSDSEITSQPTTSHRNWRLSPSPVFHLLPSHHQATYCVNSTHKDTTQRLHLNSPSSLLIDSPGDTDSQSFCQVSNEQQSLCVDYHAARRFRTNN